MRNMPWILLAILLGIVLQSAGSSETITPPSPPANPHRSPVDVCVLDGGKRAVSANSTANSVSLLDLEAGKVLAEVPSADRPCALASSPDGRLLAVSNLWGGTVSLFEVQPANLRCLATMDVGDQPRGLTFTRDGQHLYVALSGAHEIVQLDCQARQIRRRWSAPGEPRQVALTPDGRFLLAISARSGEVRCWDTASGKLSWERKIYDAFNLHGLSLSPDGKQVFLTYTHHRHNPITRHHLEQGWALNSRVAWLPVQPGTRDDECYQTALDIRGKAVGDPSAIRLTAQGDHLLVAAGGTHELLVLKTGAIGWSTGDAGDFLEAELELDPQKFQRIPLGGRPLAVQVAGSRAVLANSLLDAVQVVDWKQGKIVQQIALGGPDKPSLARQGEALFYDATRSHHQWFSCHTCHTDGHTSGRSFDTVNDESHGNSKQTPTLRNVTRTAPWTWHGWQHDLGQSIENSYTKTLHGPRPSAEQVKAVLAFLGTLEHPPRKATLSAAAQRGKALFQGAGRCSRCHQGETYTSTRNYDVGLEHDGSPHDLWNPPSLRGVVDRGPYLHDGRAETLDDVLRLYHGPDKHGGRVLTESERRDLIEFLRTL